MTNIRAKERKAIEDVSRSLFRVLDQLNRATEKLCAPRLSTSNGTARDRSNVRARVLEKAIERANEKLVKADRPTIQDGVTNHTLRRTFASLLYEAGASPAYVMAQMGHSSSALALEIYARKMERERDTGARIDALIRGADWARTGTNALGESVALPVEKTEEGAFPLPTTV